MIIYVQQKDLDVAKYDACIEKSIQSRVYAFSWYLNIVADSWDVLVYKDYEAVLPVPYMRAKRYLYRKKIIQPFFCQQLGVFSQIKDSDLESVFYKELLKKKPKVYNFNSDNLLSGYSENRINYELLLNKNYAILAKSFSKNLKRNIKKSLQNNLVIDSNLDLNNLIIFKKSVNKLALSSIYYSYMKKILVELKQQKKGNAYGVFFNNKLIAVAFFINHGGRLIHLLSGSNIKGRELKATPFLINSIIKENANTNTILDFEGSMVSGIARFFKSFGADEKLYHTIHEQ